MSSDTLDRAIIFAINDILDSNIRIEKGDCFSADLKERVITVTHIARDPITYYLLRHEKYHFSVFPKTYEYREEILKKAGKRVDAEFLEDWYFLKLSYNVVSNAIVNKYGLKYDPYRELFENGHSDWLDREISKKGDSLLLKEYIRLLDEEIMEERVVDYVVEVYEAIIL